MHEFFYDKSNNRTNFVNQDIKVSDIFERLVLRIYYILFHKCFSQLNLCPENILIE
jgi:hypothetical protein